MLAGPFDLVPSGSSIRRAAVVAARPLLERALRLDRIGALYRQARAEADGPFEGAALRALHVQVECAEPDLAHIPATGPVVVVANHPHGVLDGLVLAEVVRRVRPDARLIVNHLLSRIPELRESCFFVDPFDGPAAASRSRAGLRAAHLWLRRQGLVIVFPAGEVASRRSPERPGSVVDPAWRSTAARLALRTGATVVPAHIEGANSPWFYAAGRVHPRLRTALLGLELLRQQGRSVRVRVGRSLGAADRWCGAEAPDTLTREARTAVEALGTARQLPVANSRSTPAAEIDRLPAGACLVSSGRFQVFCAAADRIPVTLREIGRLRAVTYRQAGEGTDRDLDLDGFDADYLHLFSWDRHRACIVGAYRIGRTDEIAAHRGVEGLYTRTLFRYDATLLQRLGPALELGRSFVCAEYQRHHAALLLLWQGIGAFIGAHPQYRVLFGPVSISRRYSNLSQLLLRTYLDQHHRDGPLAELVEACHPLEPSSEPVAFAFPESMEDVQRTIRRVEPDGKGVPVLIRQYLQLNARVLGFNVDPAFSDVVDALMMVDLGDVRPALLRRYLGSAGAAAVLGHRGRTAAA
jgi:putative hemolysin